MEFQNFAWSWRIWAGVGLKIRRGSSLARISLLWRGNIHFTWLVDRYACRVIPSARVIWRYIQGQNFDHFGLKLVVGSQWCAYHRSMYLNGATKIKYYNVPLLKVLGSRGPADFWIISISCLNIWRFHGISEFCLVMTNLGRCRA